MNQRIPEPIQPTLQEYLSLVDHQVPDLMKAFYVEGSIALGGFNEHYILVSPDNIGHLPHISLEAHATFILSAASLALLELASALYGAFLLGSLSVTLAETSQRDRVTSG